jgi:hypothetical protein
MPGDSVRFCDGEATWNSSHPFAAPEQVQLRHPAGALPRPASALGVNSLAGAGVDILRAPNPDHEHPTPMTWLMPQQQQSAVRCADSNLVLLRRGEQRQVPAGPREADGPGARDAAPLRPRRPLRRQPVGRVLVQR